MSKKFIITIGREFGSGGKEIGKLLSEKLNIKLYDKEMLKVAAEESGMCEEFIKSHDERPTNSFLYSLVMDTYATSYTSNPYTEMPMNHKVFLEQFKAIKKIADEESCILIGRCADYALQDYENCLNVFIHSDLDARIERIGQKYDLPKNKAKDLISKTDKKRASYYNYFSNKKWGEAKTYHLTLNSNTLGIEECVEFIYQYVNTKLH